MKIESRFSQIALPAISIAGLVIIGLLFALADIVNYAQLGKRFTPFSVSYQVSELTYDETQVYVPGARRFFEINSLKTEVDVYELRQTVGTWPIAHSVIIGSIAKLTGSLEVSWVIAHAVFPALVWLLFFFCAQKLQLTTPSALLLATATCLIPLGFRNFFLIGQNAFVQPLELSRIPHPGLSCAILLLGIMAVSQALTVPNIVSTVIAGILIGVNFYSYYFYWMTIGLGLGAWLCTAAIVRRWNDARTLCVVGLTAIVVGAPVLVTIAVAAQSQGLTNLMERFGVFEREVSLTHLSFALLFTSAAIFVYGLACVPHIVTAFSFALAGAALGLNAHLLTGYDALDYHHFVKLCIQPLFFFLFVAAILNLLPRSQKWSWLCILATILLITLGAYRQVRVAGNILEGHDRTKSLVGPVEILRDRIAHGSVIGSADPQILTLLPVISTLWTFVPLGSRSHASNYEILRRFLIVRKLEGATISDVHADFNLTYPTSRLDRHLNYVLFQYRLSDTKLHAWINEVWPQLNLAQDLSTRRLDVLATKRTPPQLPEATGWQLVKAAPIGDWNIFQLRPINGDSLMRYRPTWFSRP
jgi:hypothetical protein